MFSLATVVIRSFTQCAMCWCPVLQMTDNGSVDELLSQAMEHFEAVFKQRPSCASCAPGRVNLIGEHTDYNDGFVFPMVHIFSDLKIDMMFYILHLQSFLVSHSNLNY